MSATPKSATAGTATPTTTYSFGATGGELVSGDVTQPTTLNGDADSSNDAGASNPNAYATGMTDYIFNTGFCHQQWADIQVFFFMSSLKLHRLILARSPYLAHLMMDSMPGSNIQLSFTDETITEESVCVVIRQLYSPALSFVNPDNARAVLATAYLFGGMPELAEHAYSICAQSLSPANIGDYVRWLDQGSRAAVGGFTFGTADSVSLPNGSGGSGSGVWADPATAPYGDFSSRLREQVLRFLTHALPAQLVADGPAPGGLHQDSRLMAAYVPLPFDLFKHCVESPALPINFMQDRFGFAKRAIAQRKKAAAAAAAAQGGAQMEESVVLALKTDGDGMAVHITRKPKRSRAALWKVEA